MSKQNQSKKTRTIALLGILTGLTILMAFTPVGYLKLGVVSISFLMIPVAVGALAKGPWAGAALGTVFGITSFAQCFGMDLFGTYLEGACRFLCRPCLQAYEENLQSGIRKDIRYRSFRRTV